MIGALLHPESLTVQRVSFGPPDDDGVPTQTITLRAWGPCNVQQLTTTETGGATQLVGERWRASGPLADWIEPGDRITWGGQDYAIDGHPAHYGGGALDHTELVLARWEG